MEAEVFPVEAQATQRNPSSRAKVAATVIPVSLKEPGESGSYSHSGVFEGAGGIHALVLGKECLDSRAAGAIRKLVNRGVSFAEAYQACRSTRHRQEFTEPPHATLIHVCA